MLSLRMRRLTSTPRGQLRWISSQAAIRSLADIKLYEDLCTQQSQAAELQR